MDINQIKMNNLIGKDQDIDASSMVSADDNSEVFVLSSALVETSYVKENSNDHLMVSISF